ncbi:MAG: ABC transporter ATP-binding protein [Gammaproteobacteria bacterium]
MNSASHEIRVVNAWCVFEHISGRKVEALRGIDLHIPPGQLVCIVGRSGHGKSTLLRALGGLHPLTDGEIYVGDARVSGPSVQRGMVFQDDTVFPWMRVRANVEFGLKAQRMPAADRRRIASQWLERVDLIEFTDSWPRELSGGMRKRVALASVFASGSEILLMDEPFGSLDYVTRLSLHQLLLDLWRRTGRTILFVTHDVEEALILADRILVMKDGIVVDDLIVQLQRPRNEDVRAHLRAVTLTKTILGHLGVGNFAAVNEERATPALD